MEDNPDHRDEQLPYVEGDTPYYEYSSLRRSSRPLIPPPLPPLPSPPPQKPRPPKRSRARILLLVLAVVSVIVVVGVIFLSSLSYMLFRQPVPAKTPIRTSPTQAPTFQVTPNAKFRSASCPFQPGNGVVDGRMVKCGYVTVPENRSNPNGPTVQLALAIFKSTNVQNDPYPVVRLKVGLAVRRWIIGRTISQARITQPLCSIMT